MQRARAMDGGPEDGLRHGLPSRPTPRDALHAARGAHRHLQRHQLGAHDPAKPPATAAAAAATPRAPTPAASASTATASAATPARAPAATRAARARAGARRAAGRAAAEAAEARQEEAAPPRPVRPRATTTAAAAAGTPGATAAAAGATTAGARAERQPGQRRAGAPRAAGLRAAGVPEVHAVAAAEVGGDAEAARVLLRGVPVQLPDARARGHLPHGHRRQPAHHHLQRGEPQRLRHRLTLTLSA